MRVIRYAESNLEVVPFLADIWPYELPLDRWPSFCGLGEHSGDKLVPEIICGVRISCVCFEHDIGWLLCDGTQVEFFKANMRFYRNLRSLVIPKVTWWQRPHAESACLFYFSIVTLFGNRAYESQKRCEYPLDDPTVRKKLDRLARASLDYSGIDYVR